MQSGAQVMPAFFPRGHPRFTKLGRQGQQETRLWFPAKLTTARPHGQAPSGSLTQWAVHAMPSAHELLDPAPGATTGHGTQ